MSGNPTWSQVIKALARLAFSKPVLLYVIVMLVIGNLT